MNANMPLNTQPPFVNEPIFYSIYTYYYAGLSYPQSKFNEKTHKTKNKAKDNIA